jgi:hypothetical protein
LLDIGVICDGSNETLTQNLITPAMVGKDTQHFYGEILWLMYLILVADLPSTVSLLSVTSTTSAEVVALSAFDFLGALPPF